MLGLPDSVTAYLFDLDGVLTDTASVHRKAWKETFDKYLTAHGKPPFTDDDYAQYVDGKPRADGVRDFLASRDIHLPEGDGDDPPTAETVIGIGNAKNDLIQTIIRRDGVKVFEDARHYLNAAKDSGVRRMVVSSSANTEEVLRVTGMDALVEGWVDGNVIIEQHLRGKPQPDSFLHAAKQLGVDASAAAVFEDAISGVQAGAAGHFGVVVGVNRVSAAHRKGLATNGATVVVDKLTDLLDKAGQ